MGKAFGWAWSALVLGGAALVVVGCGGDDEATGEQATPASACAQYAKTSCAFSVRCVPAALEVFYGTSAACEQRLAQVCELQFSLDGSKLTPDGLIACGSAVDGQSCEAALSGQTPAACDLFEGTRPVGDSCSSNLQCQSGACNVSNSEACGSCLPVVVAGESCANGQACDQGLHCASGGVCAPYVASGGSCDEVAGSLCAPPLACVNGKCGAALEAGDACDPADSDCDPYKGLVCGASNELCILRPVAGEGQACGIVPMAESFVLCGAGTYCEAVDGAGICKPRVPDGGACTASASCELAAKCLGGVCTIGLPACP